MENYFNYFTEIEERFRQCRGTSGLLSTLDWALIESWKEAGIPLEAVLLGIERSFEKFSKRPRRGRKVNSLAYCTQEVLRATQETQVAVGGHDGARSRTQRESSAPFAMEEILAYLNRNAEALEQASRLAREKGLSVLVEDLGASADALRRIAAGGPSGVTGDLEALERHLTALEDKVTASLTRASSVELLAEIRREVEKGLLPYRRKMSGAQVESLERQFLKKRMFERFQVPRLSLFYL